MCGICGLATSDPRRTPDAAVVGRMTASLAHRGPDGEGAHVSAGIGIGVRRLAIVDLEGGDQPIANEDGTVVVACNGEIYNHVELRAELERAGHAFRTRSDVEVVAHLYEDAGPGLLERLNGMFALAVWDARERRLLLARDRLGIKPLVWTRTGDGIAFASEFKALIAGGLVEPSLDPAAVDDLFAWGWVVSPRSMCAGVRRLEAGHWMTFREGRTESRRWWAPPFLPEAERPRRSHAEWAEGLRERLEESVRLRLRADVPVGAWLSAGIDSSGVTALAARATGRGIDAFSLEFDHPRYDEVGSTPTLDRFPGTAVRGHRTRCAAEDMRTLPEGIWSVEEIVARPLEPVAQRLSELARGHDKAALAGDGADEVLAGYWWYRADPLARRLSGLARRLPRLPAGRAGARRVQRLLRAPDGSRPERYRAAVAPPGAAARGRLYSPALREAVAREPAAPPSAALDLDRLAPSDRLQYWDLTIGLHDFMVHYLDRLSMSRSLEVRVPYLDPAVVEWCIAMPPSIKEGRPEKAILRRALEGVLPEEILSRPKRPFIAPASRWLAGPLPAFAVELLSEPALRGKGWFDPDAVRKALAAHRAGEGGRHEHLLGALKVQVWDEIFLRGRRPDDFDPGPPA